MGLFGKAKKEKNKEEQPKVASKPATPESLRRNPKPATKKNVTYSKVQKTTNKSDSGKTTTGAQNSRTVSARSDTYPNKASTKTTSRQSSAKHESYKAPDHLMKKTAQTSSPTDASANRASSPKSAATDNHTQHAARGFNVDSSVMDKLLKKNTQDLMSSLSPDVRRAFENLFDRIDVSDSGGITAQEIQNVILKNTSKHMSIAQVRAILKDLDMTGTGDIEFDEFIFMLSQPENYIRLLDTEDLKRLEAEVGDHKLKQTLKDTQKKIQVSQVKKGGNCSDNEEPTDTFFRALRCACAQDSMTALRTFYRNKLRKLNDHVIHDWSAGQRCIGLSDQEMLKRYETIQGELLRQRVNFCKDNSYRSSPYARPLEWGLLTLREGIELRRLKAGMEPPKVISERRAKISEFVCTPKAVPLPKYVIGKRHPLKKTFYYDQLADIRVKVDDIANTYYDDLKDIARENSKIVKKELAVEDIKIEKSRQNFNATFKAYCTPFVVSPWIPMPRPTLQASFTPLGKSKLASQRKW